MALRRLILGGLLILLASTSVADPLGPGDVPPPLVGWTRGGDRVNLTDYVGKAVIVTFWATWCTYCIKELPVLEKVQRLAGPGNMIVFAVNIEDRQVFRRIAPIMAEEFRLTLLRDADGDVQKTYGVVSLPHMVIIGRDGHIQRVWHGYSPDKLDEIIADINKALAAPKSAAP
jgi:thiol-disulfide isomerase/thioredoxin